MAKFPADILKRGRELFCLNGFPVLIFLRLLFFQKQKWKRQLWEVTRRTTKNGEKNCLEGGKILWQMCFSKEKNFHRQSFMRKKQTKHEYFLPGLPNCISKNLLKFHWSFKLKFQIDTQHKRLWWGYNVFSFMTNWVSIKRFVNPDKKPWKKWSSWPFLRGWLLALEYSYSCPSFFSPMPSSFFSAVKFLAIENRLESTFAHWTHEHPESNGR